MKKTIIKLFLSIIFLSGNFIQAQDFQGKAYYQTKTSMDMSEWGMREMSPEQKKRMEERMKSFLEKEYVLTFNQAESIYKEEEKLEAPGAGGGRGFGGFGASFSGGPKYKNVKTKEVIQDQEFFGKAFLIKDELEGLQWKMGTETKQIGQYTCFKATAIKTVDELDWRSMRRRQPEPEKKKKEQDSTQTSSDSDDPMNQIETPKTIEVTAWYTPQIPVTQGPDDYWGLPGLILEVNADRTTILCSKIILNPETKEEIKQPTKGEVVTQEEYNDIMKKKMEEMRDMFGGRGRDRRN